MSDILNFSSIYLSRIGNTFVGSGSGIRISGLNGDDDIIGTQLDDIISGDEGADVLHGAGGTDQIDGGAGHDVIRGGDGNDYLISGGDVDYVYGGSGNDYLVAQGLYTGGFATGGIFDGGSGDDKIDISEQINPTLQGGGGVDTIGFRSVVLSQFGPSNGFEILQQISNSVTGTSDADRLNFDLTAQNLRGYTALTVQAGNGNDWVGGTNAMDELYGEAGNDRLYGRAGNDKLFGGDGDDILDGGSGGDTMQGGAGNDWYYVDITTYSDPASSIDGVIEYANEGTDTVVSTVSFTLSPYLENLVLAGGNGLTGTGSAGANRIVGSDSAETLSGMDGNDILTGNGGRDILLGGNGDDSLSGGAAKDELTGGAGKDYFRFDALSDMLATTATADIIHDFSQPDRDWIILARIDADSSTVTDDAFHFVGTTAFSSTAGELRYQVIAGNTYVSGDVNGDAAADFMIRLDGVQTLTAADFAL